MLTLMGFSLDYNYIKYENEYFFQHRGIQMGGSASCSIANITVYEELRPLFENFNEIIFRRRFLDDILMIVKSSQIVDLNAWLSNLFKHKYLQFTFSHNDKCINFLDLEISLEYNNNISTKIYRKPMSKHQYLHYFSNHPVHLKNSIPYSQGLRVLKCCSSRADRLTELEIMFKKFQNRCYPNKVLSNVIDKLANITRSDLLIPKGNLLLKNLMLNNPDILTRYNIMIHELEEVAQQRNTNYLVLPFYKCIHNQSKIVKKSLLYELNKCEKEEYKNVTGTLDLCISYRKANALSQYTKAKSCAVSTLPVQKENLNRKFCCIM